MDFHGEGRPLTDEGMHDACGALRVAEAKIWAVLSVETRCFGYLPDRRPQILFERHVFHALTGGKYHIGNEDISSAKPGGYIGGAAEYSRLETALALDRAVALQSASWGIGQVMGFNYAKAGFDSVAGLVEAMMRDENSQLLAMANFIEGGGLASALRRQNWASFARGFNGESFKENEYDTRLAAMHAKFKLLLPDLTLRAAQAALVYLGFDPGPIDGLRGRRTRSALIAYQAHVGLSESGELDPETDRRLTGDAFGQFTTE